MPMPTVPLVGGPSSLLGAQRDRADLGSTLVRLASDPAGLARLYEVLGPLCHDFRNRLNSVQLTLYLADPQTTGAERRAELERLYRLALAAVEQVQQLVRPVRVTPIHLGLELLVQERADAWRLLLQDTGVALELEPPPQRAVGGFDPARFQQALEGLFRWRSARLAPGQTLRLAWRLTDGQLGLDWEEWSAEGSEPAASIGDAPGTGLGLIALASLARLVSEHGGRLSFTERPRFRVAMSWPADGPHEPIPVAPAAALDLHCGRPLG